MNADRCDFTKKCKLCGREFHATKANARYCDECRHHVRCAVCGKEIDPPAPAFSRYVKQGFLTCSPKCRAIMTSRNMMEREGISNVSQRADVRKKISDVRSRDSEETKALRSASLRAACSKEEVKEKRRKTNEERYGVTTALMRDDIRSLAMKAAQTDEAKAKRLASCKETTGYETPFKNPSLLKKAIDKNHTPEAIAKRKASMMATYGVESPFAIPSVKEKIVAAAHTKEVNEKRKQSLIRSMGYAGPLQNKEILNRALAASHTEAANAKRIATNMERYGGPSSLSNDTGRRISEYIEEYKATHGKAPTAMDVCEALDMNYEQVLWQNRNKNLGIRTHVSYFEECVASFLDGFGVRYVRHDRKVIAPLELDFYCPDQKVAIEVNDIMTHNSTLNPFGGNPKPKDYHWRKTLACQGVGVRLIHAWEQNLPGSHVVSGRIGSWDVMKNIIEHALGLSKNRVYARETKVVTFPASKTKAFFDANNVNGYRRAKTTYALVPSDVESPTPDDILMAYAVGTAYFGRGKYDLEIARGASKLGYTVVGGASKLWSHITASEAGDTIVYYVDRNYYDASSMPTLDGVSYVGHSPSFWNFFVATGALRNREPGRNAEISAGYADGSVLKVCNAGTDTYVWSRAA